MNWIDEVQLRLARGNQVLFAKNSPYLQDLSLLFQGQNHRVMALWAFSFAAESVALLEERYPAETRPREALQTAQDWAAGIIRMRMAQRKILDCHALAKELDDAADAAACHAIGQACAVVHTAGHAIGYPIYDLTALIRRLGVDRCVQAVEQRKQAYIERLRDCQAHLKDDPRTWADFMCK